MPTEVYTALLALLGVLIGYLADVLKTRISVKGDTKNHISKARFDKEFEIYQELSEKNLSMAYDVGKITIDIKMILNSNFNEEVYSDTNFDKNVEELCNHCNDADFSNKKYAPFIDKHIFEEYKQLYKKCDMAFCHAKYIMQYRKTDITFWHQEKTYDKKSSAKTIISIQKEVSELSDKILDELRDYLKSLDVKEK